MRIVEPHARGLPRQMHRIGGCERQEQRAETADPGGGDSQQEGGDIEGEHAALGAVTEAARGRLHAGEGVVFQILHGVDGVIAQGPEQAADIQQDGRPAQSVGRGGVAEQGAPVEGQAQPGLRPPGDPLHERIAGHEAEREHTQADGQPAHADQDRQRCQAAAEDEAPGLFDADLSGRDRPQGRARHLGVEVAVDDVVEGAAGRPHQRGPDQEGQQQPRVRPLALFRRRQGDALPAGQHQQPDAGRPIEAAELQPGAQGRRRMAVDPVGRHRVGKNGSHAPSGPGGRRTDTRVRRGTAPSDRPPRRPCDPAWRPACAAGGG